jgi:hypothetical protein
MDIASFKEMIMDELTEIAQNLTDLDESDLGLISGGQIEPCFIASAPGFEK